MEPVLTNPRLPQMANWICIYCIIVGPVLWLVQNASCCVTGVMFNENSSFFGLDILLSCVEALESLVVTVLLVVGGMRLRRLRASGGMLVRVGIVIALIGGLVIGCLWGVLAITAIMKEESPFTEDTPIQQLVTVAMSVAGFCELVFLIVALVWLTRHERELPLIAGT